MRRMTVQLLSALFSVMAVLSVYLAGVNVAAMQTPTLTPIIPAPSETPRATLDQAATQGVTPSAIVTRFPEPEGCKHPPDDYTRVDIRGNTLSQRTIAMLEHAQTLYGGPIDLAGDAVTQGSYNEGGVSLSFGTHDGGGAVDLSVRDLPRSWNIRWDDIPILIEALRTAGFAAYYRDEADGLSPHIHAIAIGDEDLSRAASLQLDGRYGYFRGFDALPQADGVPQFDDSGDLIICNWMRELGYEDLREETQITVPPYEFIVGESYWINMVWGQELNLRSGPGLANDVIATMPNETEVRMMDGPRNADGYQWWLVQLEDGTLGWAVDATDGSLTIVR